MGLTVPDTDRYAAVLEAGVDIFSAVRMIGKCTRLHAQGILFVSSIGTIALLETIVVTLERFVAFVRF